MPRLLFQKNGRAIWISHLDLMRLFQRAFQRAGLHLKHTQGFNPRPSVSIALPLSVGIRSQCELLDFELEGEIPSSDAIQERLNASLTDGIQVFQVYDNGRKLKELSLLLCQLQLEYDRGCDSKTANAISALFCRESLIVEKKSKNGPVQQDVIPMIHEFSVNLLGENTIVIRALICCQNPSLNPLQIGTAIEQYLPNCKPDHILSERLELFDAQKEIFR